MSIIPVKCPFCGQDLKVELSNDITLCPNCNKEFDTDKGSKYYKSIKKINIENKKIATGELYAKVDSILQEAEFYLKEQDYDSAEKLYKDALKLSTVDYRIYLGLVYVKTKTFTDLKDTEHFKYLNDAIECASEDAKERIRQLYAPYHAKRQIPEEEKQEYLKQEQTSRYKKVETLLKDSIPKHFEREKSLKLFLVLFFTFLVATATLIILGLSLEIDIITISSSAFAIVSVILLSSYFTTKSKVAIFNAVLDLFDGFYSLELPYENGIEFLKELNVTAVCVINNDSELTLKKHLLNLLNVAVNGNSQKSQEYFYSSSSISDFIKKNTEKA